MRTKILLGLIGIVFFVLGIGLTYSYFYSNTTMNNIDQKIAKFIFNTEALDSLEIPLIDLTPGESQEYEFSISNTQEETTSDVTVEYQLTILTPHYSPLIIELYKEDELIMECDETYSRNNNNELVCNTEMQELSFDDEYVDNYKLKITFDEEYNDESYSNLIDYIKLEIKSYQKV